MTKVKGFTLKDCNFRSMQKANGGKLLVYDLSEGLPRECEFSNCCELAEHVEVLVAANEEDDAITFSCTEHLNYVISLCTDNVEYKILRRLN